MQSFCQPCTLCCLDAEIHWKGRKMECSLDLRNFDAEIVKLAVDSLCVCVFPTPMRSRHTLPSLVFLERSWAIAILCVEVTTLSVPTPQSLKRIRTLRLFWTTAWDSSYKLQLLWLDDICLELTLCFWSSVLLGTCSWFWFWHWCSVCCWHWDVLESSGFGSSTLSAAQNQSWSRHFPVLASSDS